MKRFWSGFWLAFLVGSLGYAWYCFYAPSNEVDWAENSTAAQAQATESGKPVLLFFTGTWCVPCRIMKRKVFADAEVTTLVNDHFIPVLIDVDDESEAATVSRYHVGATPTTIFTDAAGNVLDWRSGRISKPEFLELLAEVNPSAGVDL